MIYNLRPQQEHKCCKGTQCFFCEFLTDNGCVHVPEHAAE